MTGLKVFVGGPIQYALDPAGGFEPATRSLLERILTALDAAGMETFSAHRDEAYGEIDMSQAWLAVTRRDFGWMRAVDVYVAVMPDEPGGLPKRSDGTCVELGWAIALGRPIVVVRNLLSEHSHLIRGLPAVGRVVELHLPDVERDQGLVVAAMASLAEAAMAQ